MYKKLTILFGLIAFVPLNAMESLAQSYCKPKLEKSLTLLDENLKKALDAEIQEQSREIVQKYLDSVEQELDTMHTYIKLFDWAPQEFEIVFTELKTLLKIDSKKSSIERVKQLMLVRALKDELFVACGQSEEKTNYFYWKTKLADYKNSFNQKIEKFKKNSCLMENVEYYKKNIQRLQTTNEPSFWLYPEYIYPLLTFGLVRMSDKEITRYKKVSVQAELTENQNNLAQAELLLREAVEVQKKKYATEINRLQANFEQASQQVDWDNNRIDITELCDKNLQARVQKCISALRKIQLTRKVHDISDSMNVYSPTKKITTQLGNMALLMSDTVAPLQKSIITTKEALKLYDHSIDNVVEVLLQNVKNTMEKVNTCVNVIDTCSDICNFTDLNIFDLNVFNYMPINSVIKKYAVFFVAKILTSVASSEDLKNSIISTAALLGKDQEIGTFLNVIDTLRKSEQFVGLTLGQQCVYLIQTIQNVSSGSIAMGQKVIQMVQQDSCLGILLRIFFALVHAQSELIKKSIGDQLHAASSKLIALCDEMNKVITSNKDKCDQFAYSNITNAILFEDSIACLNHIATVTKKIAHTDVMGSKTIASIGAIGTKAFLIDTLMTIQSQKVEDFRQAYEQYKCAYNNELKSYKTNAIYLSLQKDIKRLQKRRFETYDSSQRETIDAKILNMQTQLQSIQKTTQEKAVLIGRAYWNSQKRYEQEQYGYRALCKQYGF